MTEKALTIRQSPLSNSGKEQLPFNRKKAQAEPDSGRGKPSAVGVMGERQDKKHCEREPEVNNN